MSASETPSPDKQVIVGEEFEVHIYAAWGGGYLSTAKLPEGVKLIETAAISETTGIGGEGQPSTNSTAKPQGYTKSHSE